MVKYVHGTIYSCANINTSNRQNSEAVGTWKAYLLVRPSRHRLWQTGQWGKWFNSLELSDVLVRHKIVTYYKSQRHACAYACVCRNVTISWCVSKYLFLQYLMAKYDHIIRHTILYYTIPYYNILSFTLYYYTVS